MILPLFGLLQTVVVLAIATISTRNAEAALRRCCLGPLKLVDRARPIFFDGRDGTEVPAGAWTPDQTADVTMESPNAGDFYILCPDNDVTRELDEKRMAWAIGDIIENRPPLSRWHPDYGAAFEAFVKAT